MAAKKSVKKAGAKKAAAKKGAAAKKKAVAKKKAAASKSTAKKQSAVKKKTAAAKPAQEVDKREEGSAGAGISSMAVNLGHVFALRPRISTTFRQADFLTAKHRLVDETFASIEEAARAVAEKALELTRGGPIGRGGPRRGFGGR